ncbi:MAG: TonB family protein [Candidatus Krumholzibacteria bacterium]|nr:TonB family protein [Candidatus Krumholzibacteria bacterium]
MKNAIIISLGLHIAIGFVWFRLVKISHVRFIPRQVYTVNLVTPVEASKQPPKQIKSPPAAQPEAEKEKPEELAPPPEKPKETKPKPKEKPKEVKKTMPTTEIKKTAEEIESSETDNAQQALTGDITLDDQDFPFAYYLATMKRKIAALWQVPRTSPGEGMYCRVYFRVGKSGAIASPSIETPSGNFLFDQAALRAVVQASPLPPLPSGFADEYLGVHFSFAYEEE